MWRHLGYFCRKAIMAERRESTEKNYTTVILDTSGIVTNDIYGKPKFWSLLYRMYLHMIYQQSPRVHWLVLHSHAKHQWNALSMKQRLFLRTNRNVFAWKKKKQSTYIWKELCVYNAYSGDLSCINSVCFIWLCLYFVHLKSIKACHAKWRLSMC